VNQGWTPLLEENQRSRVLEIARDVAVALRAGSGRELGPSLASGKAGLALFFAYLDQALPDEGYDDVAAEHLESAVAALGDLGGGTSLYAGAFGVGFAMQHLSYLFEEEADDPLDALDAHALSSMDPAPDEYDLVGGILGLGVYALERLPRARARETLERVVERLFVTAERHDAGLAWRHPAALLPEWQRAEFPHGWYNLGMAHGMPGIVALLAECVRADVATARSRELLEGLVPWLLAQKLDVGGFPGSVAPGATPAPTRTAWCYGDPGVAIALLSAARAAGNEEWRRAAIAIAQDVAARPHTRQGVVDAMLCHGACGVAHVFNRFFQATREHLFADAARRWLETAVTMRRPGTGVAGFSSFEPAVPGEGGARWEATPGLLTGAAGVGLALLAAASAVEPRWDRMLLVRVPPA
jgi:lantibiotic modifying enzyme